MVELEILRVETLLTDIFLEVCPIVLFQILKSDVELFGRKMKPGKIEALMDLKNAQRKQVLDNILN